MPEKNDKFGTLTGYVVGFAALIGALVLVLTNAKELENAWNGLVNPQGISTATTSPVAKDSPAAKNTLLEKDREVAESSPALKAKKKVHVDGHRVGYIQSTCHGALDTNYNSTDKWLWIENTGNISVYANWSGPGPPVGKPIISNQIQPGGPPTLVKLDGWTPITGEVHCFCGESSNANPRCEVWYKVCPQGCSR